MKKIKLKSNEPKKKEKRSMWRTILSILLVIAIFGVTMLLILALYIVLTAPDFEKKELFQTEPTILYDKNGDELARVGTEDSSIITYDEFPNVLIDSLIATEDSRFFEHNGIDLFRFLKATVKTVAGSDDAGGASTLSMQVIKNTYTQKGQKEKSKIESLIRKFKDIYMAVFKLEANYTKEEIIEFYLNGQWFANSKNINTSGIIGVERASQFYFGKSVKDVNLAEASLMAGMFQNPYLYNPYRNPEGCRNRQRTVLKLLVRHGYITEEEQDAVLKIPIESMLAKQEKSTTTVESNQAFIDYVVNEVNEDLGINPRNGSLKIYTTFDPKIQKVLEKVEKGDVYKFPDDLIQEGIAVTSTKDGSVVALSGGRGYVAQGTNFSTDINRQPGSTAKPLFDYAMYIENISQSTYAMFVDEKTTYSNGARISNYDNSYKGLITMRYALTDSRNIPALLAFKAVYKKDPDLIKDFVHSVGINYGSELYESASIGGFNGVSPLELSAAYASFARGGYYIKPYGYTKVINTLTGEEINNSYSKKQVMEETTAFMINDILEDVFSGTGIAGKTGTTNLDSDTKKRYGLSSGAIMDSWYVTYSPSYSISLWYGYESLEVEAKAKTEGHSFTSSSGGTARKTIMKALASGIHEKNGEFARPKGLTTVRVEKETFPAQLCSSNTPDSMCISEYFVKGTEPTDASKRYATLANPTDGKYSYSGNTITISWTPIATPDAIDTTKLSEHFKKYYGDHATTYYNKRINYNATTFGTLGYDIYLKTASGETYIGFTNTSSYIYNVPAGGEYNFIVKSAYQNFKANRSSGLTIAAKTIDSNVNNIVTENTTN